MEMSGSEWERVITIGHPNGRAFTGATGKGDLNAAGDAVIANWPNNLTTGIVFRGGSWSNGSTAVRTSDRKEGGSVNVNRVNDFGGRGVR
jgi:hypothetical protein